MRAVTISGVNLARTLVLLGYAVLVCFCVGMAAGLSITGYMLFMLGTQKYALFFFGAACLPLVLIGVVGSMLPGWLRTPRYPLTPSHE